MRCGRCCGQRSEWRGHVSVPRGGRFRYFPSTPGRRQHFATIVICEAHGWSASRMDRRCHSGSCATTSSALCDEQDCRLPVRTDFRHTFCFPSRDARGPSQSDSGTGWASGIGHDAALCAPESGDARVGDSLAGIPCSKYGSHRSSVIKVARLPMAITGVRLFNQRRRSSMFQRPVAESSRRPTLERTGRPSRDWQAALSRQIDCRSCVYQSSSHGVGA